MKVPLVVGTVALFWLGAALLAGQLHLLQHVPAPAVQGVLFGLTALLLAGYFRIVALRAWINAQGLHALLLVHLSRFIGFYFVYLYRQGQLPYAFAVPGGTGDIIVATLAVVLLLLRLEGTARTRAFLIWNVIGLVDILYVVFTAVRLNLADPTAMRALTCLPLSLLPTLIVPLIIATHVVIFYRLARPAAS